MASLPSNISKSLHHTRSTVAGPVRYTGYCASGFAFSVWKGTSGLWNASPSHLQKADDARHFCDTSLSAIAAKLAASTRV